MRSWTDWKELTLENVKQIPKKEKGVYAIRAKKIRHPKSDIIYVGSAGKKGNQRIGGRLNKLRLGIDADTKERAKGYHSASWRVRKYKNYRKKRIEFSYIRCQAPDRLEKALLLACWASNCRLPVGNKGF